MEHGFWNFIILPKICNNNILTFLVRKCDIQNIFIKRMDDVLYKAVKFPQSHSKSSDFMRRQAIRQVSGKLSQPAELGAEVWSRILTLPALVSMTTSIWQKTSTWLWSFCKLVYKYQPAENNNLFCSFTKFLQEKLNNWIMSKTFCNY